MTTQTDTPGYHSSELAAFLESLPTRFPGKIQVEAEVMTDGKGHQALNVAIIQDGGIIHDEDFFYPEDAKMHEDESTVQSLYYEENREE